jgi:arylsulfatase
MPESKPNILVIWGDDIGITNLSCYSDGLMGYRTPNIDRIADEGMRFTDSYGEQSCTAGRSSFITGQSVYRTGMSKVGVPGADVGLQAQDPTIAELLKPLGYATGQFGKNHLGDLNKYLPTVHGFDEFFGNLYHLNAEEEPESPDYPSEEEFPRLYALAHPRGVLRCSATEEDGGETDPQYGPIGKQRIEDTGPLTTKRMETIDDETTDACIDFIRRQHQAGTPFFVWMNMTHMHVFTHTKPESVGQAGRWQSPYHDTMIDHDKNVGQLLDLLDELGITEDTIVVYSTDNGPHETAGRTRAPRRSAVRRTPTGRAHFGCPRSCVGRARSRQEWYRTRSSNITTGCPRSLLRPASPTSSRSSRPVTRPTRRASRSISTATTCCRTSPARRRRARVRG